MEFNEKLQQLRQRKGLTQEQLAESIYVTRAAVSKWESGRGYPSIDSLKALASFFNVTIDELLSGNELLSIAEEDGKRREAHNRRLTFGLLDLSIVLFFFIPLFGQETNGFVEGVALPALAGVSWWLKIIYWLTVLGCMGLGSAQLALQDGLYPLWDEWKDKASFIVNAVSALIYIVSLQPYAASILFVYLLIKALLLIKLR